MENTAPRAPSERAEAKAGAPAQRVEAKPNPHAERDPDLGDPSAGEPRAAPRTAGRPAPQAPEGGSSHASVAADNLQAQTLYAAGTINNHYHGRLEVERATHAQWKPLPWPDVLGRKITSVGEQAVKASLILKHSRLLVLSGEPELGKATLALDIIRRAAKDRATLCEVLQCHALDATMNVPLEAWAADPAYRDRAVLLKDAFAHGNASLRGLGRRLSREQLAQLTEALGRANMFVVVTSDTAALPPEWRSVADELCCELSPPPHDVLRRHLNDEIAGFAARPRVGPAPALQLDDEQRAQLPAALRTIPRLIRFSRHYFEALACGRSTIAAALRDFDSLTHWFMIELRDGAPAAWCLAFALCLLEADPAVRTVPWAAVMALAGLLARHLRHSIPSWKGRQPPFVEPDETLLAAARMEIVADTSANGDHVRFLDDRYGVDLWRVLAQSGRALLWTIYPLLATHVDRRGLFWLDTMTALGRIGAIDGMARLDQPLRRLAGTTSRLDHLALGRLLVGVLAGADDRPSQPPGSSACFESCVRSLRTGAEHGSAWPFMLAMREIGLGNLTRAVREMVDVTQKRIGPRLSGLDALHRMLVSALGKQRDALGGLSKNVEVARQLDRSMNESLRELFGLVFDSEIVDLLDAARFATIGLCFGRNPVEVCIAFLPHLETDTTSAVTAPDPAIGCIVAMLFFAGGPDAVFSVIDRDEFAQQASIVGGTALKQSRVILGLADDPSGRAGPFARFLACTFESLSALPPAIGGPMRDHLLLRVKRWCRDGVRATPTTPAVKELLCRLRGDARSSLSTAVTTLLRSDEEFRKAGGPLRALAVDVLTDHIERRRT